jgi:hypothetical protein
VTKVPSDATEEAEKREERQVRFTWELRLTKPKVLSAGLQVI